MSAADAVREQGTQRERLLEAMVGAVADKGYLVTTVADVTGRAGVSRATFYELFSDKEDCFLETLDWLMERLIRFAGAAWQRHGDWPSQMRAGLGAFLGAVAARPQAARVAIVESDAAGPVARERIRAAIGDFVPYVDEGRRLSAYGEALPEQVSRVVVGGVAGIVFEEVLTGHTNELLRLLPELLYTVLVPYIGHEAALEEMRAAAGRLEAVGGVGAAP
jgi:AcrR family transcriptional regulator